MINDGMMSSATGEWATPRDLFDALDECYSFQLDAASTKDNALCGVHYDKDDDGLSQVWAPHRTWVNPPYGRTVGLWVDKAIEERAKGALVVMLLPARTDTKWFHRCRDEGEIVFLRGRLRFGGATNSAPFPSMVVTFRPTPDLSRWVDVG